VSFLTRCAAGSVRPVALPQTISAHKAARLFLGAQGLLDDPARRADITAVRKLIEAIGFVQLDSINTVARAHDLTLFSRLHGYKRAHLTRLLDARTLFEHWTHDASAIPTAWYAHWKPRFRRDGPRIEGNAWWQKLLGAESASVCAHVLERIEREGPLGSADFDHPEKRGPWWGWKPQKAALDFLWRTGRLAVAGRKHFHKRYDLPERVLPDHHALPEPEEDTHREWAFRTAAERLVIFTPRELAAFWNALSLAEARVWCESRVKSGDLNEVRVESADATAPQRAFALVDWSSRLRALPEAPAGVRLLSPFDPVVRDRARALRRFGFDYRFEAFVPEKQRKYGYYVLPVLEGERLVGRIDPKLDRAQGSLDVRKVWWEDGVKATRVRQRALRDAVESLAALVGAERVTGV